MILSRDVLFLHVPKTGGMSVSSFLIDVLPPPVYYVRADAQQEDFARQEGVVQVTGRRHAHLAEAVDVLRQYDLGLDDLKLILAVIRNPYSLEVSWYHYLRAGHPWDNGPNQRLALTRDFPSFAVESSFMRPLEDFFYWQGELLPNLTIARFEQLEEDVRGALASIGIISDHEFPWRNKSRHTDFTAYYTREAEEAVYRKYRWVFDAGLYERMPELGADGGGQRRPARAYTLPIVGPVREEGEASGFGPDCRFEGTLRSTLVADRIISQVTLDGRLPKVPGVSDVTLTLSIDGQETSAGFPAGKSFSWTVPCVLLPDVPSELALRVSSIGKPKSAGAADARKRLPMLQRIVFVPVERQMKTEWDERARENAMHYVAPARTDWDEKAFFESGRRDTEEQVIKDLDTITGGANPKSMRVLEIGCGIGRMTTHLAEIFGQIRAVDVSPEMVARARDHLASHNNVLLRVGSGIDLGHFPDDRFDFCFSFRTLQRIPVHEVVVNYFREVHRVLRKGRLFKFQVQGVPPAVPGTWDGVAFSEEELVELAQDIGFDVLRMEGQGTEYFWNWWVRR